MGADSVSWGGNLSLREVADTYAQQSTLQQMGGGVDGGGVFGFSSYVTRVGRGGHTFTDKVRPPTWRGDPDLQDDWDDYLSRRHTLRVDTVQRLPREPAVDSRVGVVQTGGTLRSSLTMRLPELTATAKPRVQKAAKTKGGYKGKAAGWLTQLEAAAEQRAAQQEEERAELEARAANVRAGAGGDSDSEARSDDGVDDAVEEELDRMDAARFGYDRSYVDDSYS